MLSTQKMNESECVPIWPAPRPFEDEMLFSVISRMWHHMGRLPLATWHRHVLGSKPSKSNILFHTNIDSVARALGQGHLFSSDSIIDKLTPLNYYSHFCPPSVAHSARKAISEGGLGVRVQLGLNTQKPSLSKWVRYCPDCLAEWRDAGEEARWILSFQLPSTIVCHRHRKALEDSDLSLRRFWIKGLYPADDFIPDRSQKSFLKQHSSEQMNLLVDLACAGQEILASSKTVAEPSNFKGEYLRGIQEAGLASPGGFYGARLCESMKEYWGDCLMLWDCAQIDEVDGVRAWPLRLMAKGEKHFRSPLLHLLLRQFLASKVGTTARTIGLVDFGEGPWRCFNPIAGHDDPFCVKKMVAKRSIDGAVRASFTCECGYVYSRRVNPDGSQSKPRTISWGPVISKWVKNNVDEGRSIYYIRKFIEIDEKTVRRIFLSSVSNGEDQAATAVRDRKTPTRKKRAGAVRGRPKISWSTIEAELVDRVLSFVEEERGLLPPRRITGLSISRALNRDRSDLVKDFEKMPKLASLWKNLVETPDQWANRNCDYTISVLLKKGSSITRQEKARLLARPRVREEWHRLQSSPKDEDQ